MAEETEKHEYHLPVLLQDCLNGLELKEDGIFVDVTFGGGGHSREILKRLGANGKLFAFDQDPDAAKNVIKDKRFTFVPQNFRHLKNFLRMYGVNQVDGILADLGVSSHQFDSSERGFSIRFDAELDMRMSQSGKLSAAELINTYSEEQLRTVFREYGELENAGRLAREIVQRRSEKKFETTGELKEFLKPFIFKKDKEHQYQARVFQALRIEVNDEMGALKDFLKQAMEVLKPGGRLVVMSYHSLEDRMVKNLMRSGNPEGEIEKDFFGNIFRPFNLITKKPIEPDENEIRINNRSRSARLRIAEKQ